MGKEKGETMKQRIDYRTADPEIVKALVALNTAIDKSGLDRKLLHLVKLRASQINGCSFCVDMHTREARQDGETEQRLYLVSAWRESPLFTERERAAFAWTEALTTIAGREIDDGLYEATRAHFTEPELVNLTAAIGMINTWNRICISFRVIHPVAAASRAA